MRRIAMPIALLLAAACGHEDALPPYIAAAANATPVTRGDTIHVVEPEWDSVASRLPGRELDSAAYVHFARAYPYTSVPAAPALAVLARVPLGGGRTGVLLRAPTEQDATMVDLWVWDAKRKAWEPPVKLADGFGDGEWYFMQDAWLVDLDGDGIRDAVRRRRDTWVDDETGRAGQSDTLWVSHGGLHGFSAFVRSTDPRLLRTFDVAHWEPLADDSAAIAAYDSTHAAKQK